MCEGNVLAQSAGAYLVMLVKLATECDSEVASSAGDCAGRVQGLAAVVGAAALADLHILEARLHAREDRGLAVRLKHRQTRIHPLLQEIIATYWELWG